MKSFILIQVELGFEESTGKEIKKINGVSDVFYCTGNYDLTVQTETESPEQIHNIMRQIRFFDHIISSMVLIADPIWNVKK